MDGWVHQERKGRRPLNSTGANNLQPIPRRGYILDFTLDFIQDASETQVHSRAFSPVCHTEGAERGTKIILDRSARDKLETGCKK
jgi:hypothetical protein